MSGWLNDVLVDYLDRVTEREFDATFLLLLRGAGFRDIHHLHGAYEFGKDFIAKRDGLQWAFQTKAGDINLGAWRVVRPQIEEMLHNDIAHPSFDVTAHRRAVLVTTGRLIGGAPADAQQHSMYLTRRHQPAFSADEQATQTHGSLVEIWDRETLLEDMATNPDISLNTWNETGVFGLLEILGDISSRRATVQSIERLTRNWDGNDPVRACLAAAIVASQCQMASRQDLACHVALCLTRTSSIAFHDRGDVDAELLLDAARTLYASLAQELRTSTGPIRENPTELHAAGSEPPGSITYAIRCSVIVETLGLLGLLRAAQGDVLESLAIAKELSAFVAHQPGAAHPISDRWAASLVPAATLLRRHQQPQLVPWLEDVSAWICDRHYRLPGLASVYADPRREIDYLLGDPYDHVVLPRRKQSLLASTILDLGSTLELPDLFVDAYNDFTSVDLAYPVMEPLDGVGQYGFDGTGIRYEPNIDFDEHHDFTASWKTAVHHRRAPSTYKLQQTGRAWELLATGAVVRDRLFLPAIRELAGFDRADQPSSIRSTPPGESGTGATVRP